MIRDRLFVLISVVAFFFSACASDEELLGGLDVQQAVEIVVALKNSGVASEMVRTSQGRDERYTIKISRLNRDNALRVLNEYKLPRKDEDTFESLTSGDSFVPNARETAQLRLDRALAFEVERALGALDNIVEVRAIIRSQLVQNLESSAVSAAPTASVLIRFVSKSGTQPFSSEDVLSTVSKAVPGLAKENITLTTTRVFLGGDTGLDPSAAGIDSKGNITPLARVNPFPFMVPASDQVRVRNILSALLGTFALTGLLIGWALSRSKRPKAPPPKAMRTAMLEASFKGPGDASTPVPSKRAVPSGPKGA